MNDQINRSDTMADLASARTEYAGRVDGRTVFGRMKKFVRAGWSVLARRGSAMRIRRMEKQVAELVKCHPFHILYNNDRERNAIHSFHEMRKCSDFERKYLELIRGLDPESQGTVARIVRRQQLIMGTEGKELDLFTPQEKIHLAEIKAEIKSGICMVSEGVYAYRNYLLPTRQFPPCVFWDRYGLDRVEHLEATADRDIVDVGGYVGDTALLLSPLTRKQVHVFESVAGIFKLLQKTIALNQLQNVVPVQAALGSQCGPAVMNVSQSCSSFCQPTDKVSHRETVEVLTLDQYVADRVLDVGLIKVDIEGFEQEFLKGAEQTIRLHKPILLLSIYHNASDFFDIKPRIESWNLGYKFKIHKPIDFSVSREVLLIAEVR